MSLFKFRSISLFVFLICAVNLSAQKSNSSLLWEIKKDGYPTSYLYGTMHVSNKIAFHLGDTFFLALDKVDVVALETNPGEWMQNMFEEEYSMSLRNYMERINYTADKNFYEYLVDASSPDNPTLTYALRNTHSLQNGFLYRGSEYNEEFEENTYLDLFIYQYAGKNKKIIQSLEDYQYTNVLQIKAMIPDDLTKEEKEQRRKKSAIYQWNSTMSVAEAMQDAYRKGDIYTIDSIVRLTSSSDNYLKYFLHERNAIMVESMGKIISDGKSVFAGVGAAHLAGDKGMITMLKAKGFQVRPIQRNISEFAKNKKNDIEEFFIPLNSKTVTSKDGYLSMRLPGNLYETPGEKGDLQYFYPEMINGGYYFISRFHTFAPLNKNSLSDWKAKLDSLFFENIEGKIISEKEVNVSGYPAIDVVNKTRKGDYQRRLIVFTPLEIIFFKMGGIGEWVNLYGEEFFSSIKIGQQYSNNSYTYTSHLNEYSLTFPKQPIHSVHAKKISDEMKVSVQCLNEKDSTYYFLFNDFINDVSYIEEDSFELVHILQTFIHKLSDTLNFETKLSQSGSFPAAIAQGKFKDKTLHLKSVLAGNNYFVLGVFNTDEQKSAQFFDSFKFTGEYHSNSPQHITDSIRAFHTLSQVKLSDLEYLIDSVRHLRKLEDKEDWDHVKTERSYYNKKTRSYVYVEHFKHSDYYYKDQKELIEYEFDEYDTETFVLVNKKDEWNKEIKHSTRTFGIKGSNKVIEVHKYFQNAEITTLYFAYDTLLGKDQFTKDFVKEFKVLPEQEKSLPISTIKASVFFADVYSGDSLRLEKAMALMDRLKFKPKHVDSLLVLIKDFEWPKTKRNEMKEELILAIGKTESKEAIPYLVKMYQDNYEPDIHFALLKALARIPSKKSYAELTKLLVNRPPVAKYPSTVRNLFYFMDDSLELTNKIFPDAWELLLYSEYRNSIYEIASELLDSNLIKTKKFRKKKPLILREALAESQASTYDYDRNISLKNNDYKYVFGNRVEYPINPITNFNLYKYLNLLAPFYPNDADVQRFFNHTFENGKIKAKMVMAVVCAKYNYAVPDSIIERLSADPRHSFAYYAALKNFNKLNYFNPTYIEQEHLMKSAIYAKYTSLTPKDDSLNFVGKYAIRTKTEYGDVYFFSVPKSRGKGSYLYHIGLQKEIAPHVSTTILDDFTDSQIEYYTETEKQKEIDEIIKYLFLNDRNRAYRKTSSNSYWDF